MRSERHYMKVAIVTAPVLIWPLRGKQEINELKNTCAWFHQWCLLSLDINTALNHKHNFYYILVRRNEFQGFFRGLHLNYKQGWFCEDFVAYAVSTILNAKLDQWEM